jgi:hypothetical protein
MSLNFTSYGPYSVSHVEGNVIAIDEPEIWARKIAKLMFLKDIHLGGISFSFPLIPSKRQASSTLFTIAALSHCV